MKSVIVILTILLLQSAHADEFGFTLGPNWSTLSRDGTAGSTTTVTSKMSYFFGAHLAYTLVPDTFDIEAGLEYWKRQYESTAATAVLEDSLSYLSLPVVGRYWLTDFMTFGIGMFYAVGVGNVDRTVTFQGITTNSSITRDQAGFLNSDFGFLFDLKTSFAMDANWRLIMGTRYVFGISDVDNFTASTSQFRDIRAIIGAAYEL